MRMTIITSIIILQKFKNIKLNSIYKNISRESLRVPPIYFLWSEELNNLKLYALPSILYQVKCLRRNKNVIEVLENIRD